MNRETIKNYLVANHGFERDHRSPVVVNPSLNIEVWIGDHAWNDGSIDVTFSDYRGTRRGKSRVTRIKRTAQLDARVQYRVEKQAAKDATRAAHKQARTNEQSTITAAFDAAMRLTNAPITISTEEDGYRSSWHWTITAWGTTFDSRFKDGEIVLYFTINKDRIAMPLSDFVTNENVARLFGYKPFSQYTQEKRKSS